jgi:hypothetical protein
VSAALRAVAWGGVLADLAAALPDLGDQVTQALRTPSFMAPRIAALAVLTAHGGEALTVPAVVGRGGTTAAGAWLHRTGRNAVRFLQPDLEPLPDTGPERPTSGPATPERWLVVDAGLCTLPLLDILERRAARTRRPLTVRHADLWPAVAARCGRLGHADVIELDTRVLFHPTWAGTWLHEVGHLLDPRDTQRTAVDQERYAETFAGLAAAGPLPTCLEDLDGLARAADAATPAPVPAVAAAVIGDELPADGVPSLLAFAGLCLDR